MSLRRFILPLLLVLAPVSVALALLLPVGGGFEPNRAVDDGIDSPPAGEAPPTATGPGESFSRAPLPEVAPPEEPTEEALFQYVGERARRLASRAYAPPPPTLPPHLAELTYDEYRGIRFRPEEALWQDGGPVQLQFFHPGFLYPRPVRIHEVAGGEIREVSFQPSNFAYEGPAAHLAVEAAEDAPSGFAGFRVHYPVNREGVMDEVLVFLGASYFRLLGPGQVHGLSTRGVAVDPGEPHGEEFPDFVEFWLLRPPPGEDRLPILALMDGPSLSGAYLFRLEPGSAAEGRDTRVEVEARLFARRDISKLGVAPLTSMFLHGPLNAGHFEDFRPRVHDSEGLLMWTGMGEWIWRPLSNGPGVRVTSLRDRSPRGFGLVQRTRDFTAYLDLEAQYHRRPSQWVEVGEGDWGTGGVELLEIPATSEFEDNIVAYWHPDEPLRAGESRSYSYRLRTFDARLPEEELGWVGGTHSGPATLPGEVDPAPRDHRRFLVDFHPTDGGDERESAAAATLGGSAAQGGSATQRRVAGEVEAVVEASSGEFRDLQVQALPGDRGWRASWILIPDRNRGADMRLHLERDGVPFTETWSYLWIPDDEG